MKKENETIIAYKGFDKDLKCRGFQFKIGETFNHSGDVLVMAAGLHVCEHPLDIFGYYSPAYSRFAVVEASPPMSFLKHTIHEGSADEYSYMAITSCQSMSIKREVGILELVGAARSWILSNGNNSRINNNSCENSIATNREICSLSISDGDHSVSANMAELSIAESSGLRSAAISTGHLSASLNDGDLSASISVGDRSAAVSSGDFSIAAVLGSNSVAFNDGNASASVSVAEDSSAINIGAYSVAFNAGNSSLACVDGEASIAIATGIDGKAKASDSGFIVLCCWNDDGTEIIHIRASKVGENGVKADTWYSLNENGEFVEVQE